MASRAEATAQALSLASARIEDCVRLRARVRELQLLPLEASLEEIVAKGSELFSTLRVDFGCCPSVPGIVEKQEKAHAARVAAAAVRARIVTHLRLHPEVAALALLLMILWCCLLRCLCCRAVRQQALPVDEDEEEDDVEGLESLGAGVARPRAVRPEKPRSRGKTASRGGRKGEYARPVL